MSHKDQPEYFTLASVCPYNGNVTIHGIFENMDAVVYRMKQMYSSCGDEYRIECFHLTTAEDESDKYNEQVVSRAKCKQENEIKEKLYQEHTKEDEGKFTLLTDSLVNV